MKKILLLLLVSLIMTGCVVYPDVYGSYDSGYYGFPYGYANPGVNLNFYGGYYGHHGGYGYYHGGYGYYHGGHGGGWRR